MTKKDQISEVVDKALHDLGEHFEHVQILLTRTVEGRTHSVMKGCGNWHARIGICHEFINNEVAQEHAIQLADKLNPPDEG